MYHLVFEATEEETFQTPAGAAVTYPVGHVRVVTVFNDSLDPEEQAALHTIGNPRLGRFVGTTKQLPQGGDRNSWRIVDGEIRGDYDPSKR